VNLNPIVTASGAPLQMCCTATARAAQLAQVGAVILLVVLRVIKKA
jgi:hypothetical protein